MKMKLDWQDGIWQHSLASTFAELLGLENAAITVARKVPHWLDKSKLPSRPALPIYRATKSFRFKKEEEGNCILPPSRESNIGQEYGRFSM
jgi:hypothetical protein